MPAEGGQARRLTWLGTDMQVRGWTPAGEIALRDDAGPAVLPQPPGFARRAGGGPPRRSASARSTTSRSAPAAASRSAATPTTRRAGSATAAARAGASGSTPRAAARSAACRARRQRDDADVDRRSRLLPRRRRRRRQPLLVPPRRQRPAPPHRPRRLLRAPGADRRQAHRLPVRRATCGCSTRRATRRARSTSRRPAHRTQAARRFVAAASTSGGSSLHPAGHTSRSTRAASCSRCRSGKARDARSDGARRRRRGSPAFGADGWRGGAAAMARRRHDDGRGERARAERWSPRRRRAHAAVGHRPRHRAASPRRSAARSRSPTIATKSGSATSRAARSRAVDTSEHGRSDDLAWSPDGAWLAYTFAADTRHIALKLYRRRRTDGHAGDASPSSATRRRRSIRRALPVLRVGAHLRSGLRQRPLRPQLPARRAART